MNLDKSTIVMRPRRPWEAVDLGVLMARRWWASLIRIWLVLTLPVFIISCFLPQSWLPYQMLLLWWLKPIFERPLLYCLSQNVFGAYPSLMASIKTLPKLALKQIFLSLTWRRFSPSRSLDLPVIVLEGLYGDRRANRLRILHREGVSPAAALTLFGIHFESFIALSILVLAFAFVPEEFGVSLMGIVNSESYWFTLVLNTAAYVGMALVAPFYVASGFALYLNRRIDLEAWDIEIAFRRIVDDRQKKVANVTSSHTAKTAGVVVSLFVTATLFVTFPPISHADDGERGRPKHNLVTVHEEINEIKKQDEFNVKASVKRIKHSKDQADDSQMSWDLSWMKLPERFLHWLSRVGEYLLWLIVIALVLFVSFRYRHWLKRYAFSDENRLSQANGKIPETLFGLDVTRHSLPENVSETARALWLSGDKRQALALVYRASLAALIDFGVPLRSGDTEGLCLQKVEQCEAVFVDGGNRFAYFETLTEIWKQYAYGHIEPCSESTLNLCHSWNDIWLGSIKVGHEA